MTGRNGSKAPSTQEPSIRNPRFRESGVGMPETKRRFNRISDSYDEDLRVWVRELLKRLVSLACSDYVNVVGHLALRTPRLRNGSHRRQEPSCRPCGATTIPMSSPLDQEGVRRAAAEWPGGNLSWRASESFSPCRRCAGPRWTPCAGHSSPLLEYN